MLMNGIDDFFLLFIANSNALKASLVPQSGQICVFPSALESAGGSWYICPQMGQILGCWFILIFMAAPPALFYGII